MEDKKFENLEQYFASQVIDKQELKDLMLRSALLLATTCAHNFEGDATLTEEVAMPLFYLNDILDKVQ